MFSNIDSGLSDTSWNKFCMWLIFYEGVNIGGIFGNLYACVDDADSFQCFPWTTRWPVCPVRWAAWNTDEGFAGRAKSSLWSGKTNKQITNRQITNKNQVKKQAKPQKMETSGNVYNFNMECEHTI